MHAQATIGFGFTSDWLKKWCENFAPITEWSNANKSNLLINFYTELKTALYYMDRIRNVNENPLLWLKAGQMASTFASTTIQHFFCYRECWLKLKPFCTPPPPSTLLGMCVHTNNLVSQWCINVHIYSKNCGCHLGLMGLNTRLYWIKCWWSVETVFPPQQSTK